MFEQHLFQFSLFWHFLTLSLKISANQVAMTLLQLIKMSTLLALATSHCLKTIRSHSPSLREHLWTASKSLLSPQCEELTSWLCTDKRICLTNPNFPSSFSNMSNCYRNLRLYILLRNQYLNLPCPNPTWHRNISQNLQIFSSLYFHTYCLDSSNTSNRTKLLECVWPSRQG